MGIRESLLNTITSVGNSDFVRIVTSAGASSKATVANLFKSFESGLSSKSSLTTSDYIRVVGSDNNSYKQSVSSVADAILPLLKKTVPSGTDTSSITEIGDYYSTWTNIPTGSSASGYLWVLPHNSSNAYRKQIYSPYGDNTLYIRTLNGNNWTSWEKLPTRADVDALNEKTTPQSFSFDFGGKTWLFYKTGRIVHFQAANDIRSAAEGTNDIGTLPAGYRPVSQVYLGVQNALTDNQRKCFVTVGTTGIVRFYTPVEITSANNNGFAGTYIAAP